MKVATAISASQRGPLINDVDRRPRLTRNIASAKYKGALTNGPRTMRYAIAIDRIAISHQNDTMEQGRYICDLR